MSKSKTNPLLEEASNPETSTARLSQIYEETKNYNVKIAVASNPNISPELMQKCILKSHMVTLNPALILLSLENPGLLDMTAGFSKLRYKILRKCHPDVIKLIIDQNKSQISVYTFCQVFRNVLNYDTMSLLCQKIERYSVTYTGYVANAFYAAMVNLSDQDILKIYQEYGDKLSFSLLLLKAAAIRKCGVRRFLQMALKHGEFNTDRNRNTDTITKIAELLVNDPKMAPELDSFVNNARVAFRCTFPKEDGNA